MVRGEKFSLKKNLQDLVKIQLHLNWHIRIFVSNIYVFWFGFRNDLRSKVQITYLFLPKVSNLFSIPSLI